MDFEDDFCKFLEEKIAKKIKLKGYDDERKKEFYKNPNVIKGFILPRIDSGEAFSELPYICFRLTGLETRKVMGKNVHVLKTNILCGCYCSGIEHINKTRFMTSDGSGYRDLWNIMEYIRQALFNGKYLPRVQLFEDDFSIEISNEQYYPIWEGQINANFLIGIPDYI